PLVDGESLRERLTRDGPLPGEEALQIGREVSQALTHAHAQGVVHRDLKPENIMLSGGVAVVMDFGIAYAASFAGGEQLTATGLAIGTPAYMSPEQAAGGRGIDHRSDVYSLGCVLYEMLAGRPPFQGGSVFAVLSQLATQEAPDLRGIRPDVPLPVALAIRTALAKDPANRFASVADLLAACDGATGPVRRLSATPRLRRRTQLLLGGAATLIVAGGLWLGFQGGSTGSRESNPVVAVLPFDHIGPEAEAYVPQGIGNEVSNSISGIGGISVISRASAVQFNRQTPLAEVKRELNADFVVRGSVQTNRQADGGTEVRLSTQLINVADGRELYSDTLTASLNSEILFKIQQQIARRVADALTLTLRPQTLEALRQGQTTNPEAYRAYLQGSIHAAHFLVLPEQQMAIQFFTQATTLDPGFALAWARLAQLEAVYYGLYDRT
ncbi:MAG: protein kinase, partial [Gemmatimonadota bacterium]